MKKIVALMMAAAISMTLFASCTAPSSGGKENQTSKATSAEIFDAIDASFVEKYPDAGAVIPNMPIDVDDTTLNDKFGIAKEDLEDYKGQIAGMMTNCDMLLVVKAKEGKLEAVKESLETAKKAQTEQFASYGVMGNIERTKAAKVVTQGNYAALIMVGILPEDPDAAFDFASDVKLAEESFHKTIDSK